MAGKSTAEGIDGVAVEHLRNERGWSQQRFAQKAGTSLSTVQRAEASDPKVTYGSARKLARALEVPVTAIFPTDDEPPDIVQRLRDERSQAARTAAPPWFTEQLETLREDLTEQLEAITDVLARIEAHLPATQASSDLPDRTT